MKFLQLLIALSASTLAHAAPAVPTTALPDGELIDRVWAGHPVPLAFLAERGHQFILNSAAEPTGFREAHGLPIKYGATGSHPAGERARD